MSPSISQIAILVYWGTWTALQVVSKALYRGERRYEKWEIIEAYPQHKHALRLYPLIAISVTGLMLIGLLLIWSDTGLDELAGMHFLGLILGLALLLDASFPWITGVRPLQGLRGAHYVIEESRTWRPKLQLGLAVIYVAVPAVLLVSMIV